MNLVIGKGESVLKKRLLLVGIVAVLAGCEGSEEEETPYYRISTVSHLDVAGNQTGVTVYKYSSSDVLTRLDTYTGKGTDASWGTADDVLGYYSVCAFSGTGTATYRDLGIEYSAAPLETTALAAWNALGARPVRCADGMADYPMASEVTYNAAPGVQDVEEGKYRFERTGTNTSRWTSLVSAVTAEARSRDFFYVTNTAGGLDGIRVEETSGTTSAFVGYYKYTFNSDGQLIRRELHDDAGANDLWGDADDHIRSYENVSRFSESVTLRLYSGTGTDSTWFNGNDTQSGYIIYVYKDGLLESETVATAAGVDGIWETLDDVRTVQRFNYEKI